MIRIWRSKTNKVEEVDAKPGQTVFLGMNDEIIKETSVFQPAIYDINSLLDTLKRARDAGASDKTQEAIESAIQCICHYATNPHIWRWSTVNSKNTP